MTHFLVIGGASLDLLHFDGRTEKAAGGAGMYTAMAAQKSGVRVSMLAPRPEPLPERLRPVAERLVAWQGPVVSPAELPRFEISHEQGETSLIKASFGAELELSPDMLLAETSAADVSAIDLSAYGAVHIVPLGDAQRQLDFLRACRERGAEYISVGTYEHIILEKPEVVRTLFREADAFFMNEKEAIALFGSLEEAETEPGKLLFITLGKRGVIIYQGSHASIVEANPVEELDPTGAGDTLCGATLAHLLRGEQPIMAVQQAMPLAAQMTEFVGPAALLQPGPPPGLPLDPRVAVNEGQVNEVAQLVAKLPEVRPFDFTGPDFPPVGHPRTLDFFLASIAQQFSFWTAEDGRYRYPLMANINGARRKGSDYLFLAYRRRLDFDPEFFKPARQAEVSREEMLALFRADDGSDPMPALELHLSQAQAYGRDMLALGIEPEDVLRLAQESVRPLGTFLSLLDHIGGYKEDPLRKKSGLLALILNQRPEGFLPIKEGEYVAPVIDYHLMRSCLRIGLIDVLDEGLKAALVARKLVSPAEEWAVRYAAYRAIEQLVVASGKSMGAVDWFFFNARRRCPEMSEPLCELCQVDPVCAHRKELFQAVLRTTFY